MRWREMACSVVVSVLILAAVVSAAIRPGELRDTFDLLSGPSECPNTIRVRQVRNMPARETVEIDVDDITMGSSSCGGRGYLIMALQDGRSALNPVVRRRGGGGGGGGRPSGGGSSSSRPSTSKPSGGSGSSSSRPGGSGSRPVTRPPNASSKKPGKGGFIPGLGSVLRPSGSRPKPPKGTRLRSGGLRGKNWLTPLWIAAAWRGGKGRRWKKRRSRIGGDDTEFEDISEELDELNVAHYYGYHAEPSLVGLGENQDFTRWGFTCGRHGVEFRTRFLFFELDREYAGRLAPFGRDVKYLLTQGLTFDDELSAFSEVPCVYYGKSGSTGVATATNTNTNVGGVCMPADAPIRMHDGTTRRADNIAVGDQVDVGGDSSEVYMFTHADAQTRAEFLRMTTASGAVLELTASHHLYANGELAPAGAVRVGDVLRRADAKVDPVASVERVVKRGLYNPQTAHGDISVGEFVISTYTSFVEPKAAHPLLAPLRAVYRLHGWSHSVNGLPTAFQRLLR